MEPDEKVNENDIDEILEENTKQIENLSIEDKVIEDKKLTHKEKKKLKKQQEYEKQMETLLKKGGQGHSELESNFTVSQSQKSAGQMAAMENAVDIKVENFSIAAKGNDLFVNANLLIANGRHYGLVGPNGLVSPIIKTKSILNNFFISDTVKLLCCVILLRGRSQFHLILIFCTVNRKW